MTFAAFTSALIVRQGGATDWQHLTLPPILYLNTLVIIRQQLRAGNGAPKQIVGAFMTRSDAAAKNQAEKPTRWLYITLFLGLLFVAGQYVAWLQLRSQGLYSPPIPTVLSSMC